MLAESVYNRDREGFLKCKDCPRRFLTKIGFENHSFIQHKKETKTKLGENQQSQTIEDESSFKQDTFGNVFFGSQVDPIQQRSSEHLIITHQCSECKKMFSSAICLRRDSNPRTFLFHDPRRINWRLRPLGHRWPTSVRNLIYNVYNKESSACWPLNPGAYREWEEVFLS